MEEQQHESGSEAGGGEEEEPSMYGIHEHPTGLGGEHVPDLLVALGDDVEAVARPAHDGVRHGPRHHLVVLHSMDTGKAMQQHMTGGESG